MYKLKTRIVREARATFNVQGSDVEGLFVEYSIPVLFKGKDIFIFEFVQQVMIVVCLQLFYFLLLSLERKEPIVKDCK